MRNFRLAKRPNQTEECLEILREFMANIADRERGVRLVGAEKKIARFLQTDMDLLTGPERYRVYGFMEAMFPKHFRRILVARFGKETDPECLRLLKMIAELHSLRLPL